MSASARLRDRPRETSAEQHVDLFKVDPLSSAPPRFLRRLALDDPMLVTANGKPTQLATGWATYTEVSAPHTMAECPHVTEDPSSALPRARREIQRTP